MAESRPTVDVIIPTYQPDDSIIRLLELLQKQTYEINHILIINTEKKLWDELTADKIIPGADGTVEVIHISRDEFDHGNTRKMGAAKSSADFFLMMTQDAMPYDFCLVEKLIAPMLLNEQIAVSYARQLPRTDATIEERFVRSFNYPDTPMVKDISMLQTLGIKTFFCSNVCAMYRKKTYDELGGFIEKTIFNEDMIYASKAVRAGYLISYTADACVYHSHNYSGADQFHRNFDLAVSQAQHPEVFEGLSSEGEGMKLVKNCISFLAKNGKIYRVPGFIWNCGCRFLGFRLGKKYQKLPVWMVLKFTSNKSYWL